VGIYKAREEVGMERGGRRKETYFLNNSSFNFNSSVLNFPFEDVDDIA
jgi:hypothetical protein